MISVQRNKLKNLLLGFLIFLILTLIVLMAYKKGYIEIISHAMQGQKTEKNIIDGIAINHVNLIYDSDSNTYYFPIKLEDNNEEVELAIEISSSYFLTSKIGDKEFSKKINLSENVDYNQTIEISVESFLYTNNYTIKFTNLPIIAINYNEEEIGTEYTYSEFSITDPDYIENNSKYQFYSDSKVRYRGSSTLGYGKKSYRVKLEKNVDFGLLGMNCNKTWILDALATDSSCLRTKIASDLWGDINQDLETEKYVELNSKYVELYVNGSYNGLYLLKEVIDEELLDLDKDTGVLIKGVNWNQIDFTHYENINSDTYGPFELKYPKNAKKYTKSWTNILDKLKEYYTGNINYNVINETFYIENLANHKIFLLILYAIDNYEFKNMYYSIEDNNNDTKVLITPWDLDLTFGLLWDDDVAQYTYQYEKVENVVEPFGIRGDEEFQEYLKERWNFLSESVLSKNKINDMIDEQYEYLTKAEVLEKENKKYHNINTANEKEELKNWYSKRFEVTDYYIKSL